MVTSNTSVFARYIAQFKIVELSLTLDVEHVRIIPYIVLALAVLTLPH
jgi:hypothetical protein